MNSRPALARRTVLQPVWPDGATFKVIGLGGVGGIVARYLTVFLAAREPSARLVLIDGDSFEPANAGRMWFGRLGNKAAVVADELVTHAAGSALSLLAIEDYVTTRNIDRLIREGDLVLLAVDNLATRKLVNDHCAQFADICVVSGGNDGVEPDPLGRRGRGTFGNVQLHVRRGGADATPPLTWQHPEIQQPADQHPAEKSCTELAPAMPQILFANLTVAAAMLNTLWLHLCGATHYGELVFDIADGLMRPMPLSPPGAAHVCPVAD